VTRAIQPSPARAEPHDARAWFPVPDPSALPSIDALLAGAREVTASGATSGASLDLVSLEAIVSSTPARAEPFDARAWLPLPGDLDALPPALELLEPPADLAAAIVAEAEALVSDAAAAAEAAVAPSPARAAPHDSATWLPLPDPESLLPLSSMGRIPAGVSGRPRRRTSLRRPRMWLLLVLVASTGIVAVRLGSEGAPPAVAGVAPFEVTVDLDGNVSTVNTTARTPAALGRQLDVDKLVGVRESPERLGAGAHVVLRTRKSGQLEFDGQTVPYDSPSLTVAELLADSNVVLDGDDTTVPGPDEVLHDGTRVRVVRVGAATRQTEEPVEFETETAQDPTIPIGETREIRAGVAGVATITWRARIENGVEVGQTMLSRVITTEPVSRVVGHGTQADWHWDALAQCESGGRWNTVDSAGVEGFHGGLGIYYRTWIGWGGLEFAPNAGLATREEQIIVGQRIYDDLGWDPWGCATGALGWA
jgi:resuscitation-promoting factor RpfB